MATRSPAGIALAASMSVCLAAGAAAPVPTITIVEGQSTIISGTRGFVPAKGVPLRQCDIVRVGPQALVQAEFDDGGQIVVGHDSRMLFELPGSDEPAVSPMFLMSGWAKVAVPRRERMPPYRIVTPLFDLSMDAGAVVLHAEADGVAFFVETGDAVAQVPGGGARAGTTVTAGHTYVHKAGQPAGTVAKGIDKGFLSAMPRSMRDSLPSLLARLKARDVSPQPAPGYDPKEAEQWFRTVAQLRPCIADNTIRSGQEALERQGFDVGAVDGILGPRTRSALQAFQQKHGLTATGRFDPETLDALNVAGRR